MLDNEDILNKFFNGLEKYLKDSKKLIENMQKLVATNNNVIRKLENFFDEKSKYYLKFTYELGEIEKKYLAIINKDKLDEIVKALKLRKNKEVSDIDINLNKDILKNIKDELKEKNKKNIKKLDILKNYYTSSINLIKLRNSNKLFTKNYIPELLVTIAEYFDILESDEMDKVEKYLNEEHQKYLKDEEEKRIKEEERIKKLWIARKEKEKQELERLEEEINFGDTKQSDTQILDNDELELLNEINRFFYNECCNLKYINNYDNYKYYSKHIDEKKLIDTEYFKIDKISEIKKELDLYNGKLILKDIYKIIDESKKISNNSEDYEVLDEYLHENLLIISNLYNELKKDNNINDKKSKNRRHLIFLNNNNNNDTDYTNTKFYKFIKNIPKEYYSSFKYLLNELEYNDINLNNGLKYKKFHCGNQKGIYEIRALGIRIFFTILPNKDIYVITGILKKHFNKYLENNYIYLLSSLAYDSYDDIANNLNDNNYIENNKNVYDDIINYIDNKGRNNYNLL